MQCGLLSVIGASNVEVEAGTRSTGEAYFYGSGRGESSGSRSGSRSLKMLEAVAFGDCAFGPFGVLGASNVEVEAGSGSAGEANFYGGGSGKSSGSGSGSFKMLEAKA